MALNFDEKIFWFPEPWIELRKELSTHWSHDKKIKPYWHDPRCGWAMAYDAEMFIEYMNEHCDNAYNVILATRDDQKAIGYVCGLFLKYLRRKRGEANP